MTADDSPSTPLIAITGATGKVGSRVAHRLAGTGACACPPVTPDGPR